MNLRKTLFSAFAAVALSATLATPMVMAGTPADGTTATVDVTNGGEFDAHFCGPVNLGAVTLTSAGDEKVAGGLEVCYTDTQGWRPGFQVQVQAGDFTSTGNPELSASNFKLTSVFNPWQGQWDSSSGVDVGDIGGWNGDEQVTDHGADTAANHGSLPYIDPASLDHAQYIAYAWDGVGTGSGELMPPSGISAYPDEHALVSSLGVVDGTYQVVGVELTVPRGTETGLYSSELTLTIIPVANYPN